MSFEFLRAILLGFTGAACMCKIQIPFPVAMELKLYTWRLADGDESLKAMKLLEHHDKICQNH